jgi:hypothetical protein
MNKKLDEKIIMIISPIIDIIITFIDILLPSLKITFNGNVDFFAKRYVGINKNIISNTPKE